MTTTNTTAVPAAKEETATTLASKDPGVIRRVLKSETYLIKEHLLRLDSAARYRRFNHDVSDAYIAQYAHSAANLGNLTYGCFFGGQLIAIAELRCDPNLGERTAEVAFSVEDAYANRGIATRLMGRIIRSARNLGLKHLVLVCVAENTKMQAIARHYHAEINLDHGSIVADIVPRQANFASIAREFIDDRVSLVQAAIDLQLRLVKSGDEDRAPR